MKNIQLDQKLLFPEPVFSDVDYFALRKSDLQFNGYEVQKHRVVPDTQFPFRTEELDGYGFNPSRIETVVFNLPTGSGKSETFYDLIKEYSEKEKHLVLVCSPFVKLVEKDVDALRSKGVDLFDYKELETVPDDFSNIMEYLSRQTDARVHVMTVNCLLRNPGEDRYEQAAYKTKYLEGLLEEAERKHLKVVIFIDELHETVHNLTARYLPNLLLWKTVLQKIFVASATFTVSSLAAVQLLARLTENRITIFESQRENAGGAYARLRIHFTHQPYSANNLGGLECLKYILDSVSTKQSVNILVAHKRLVDALTKKKDSPVYKHLKTFNVTTADTNNEFKPEMNNIGTTFKTGINITAPDNVYIVILPAFPSREDRATTNEYGIFADGISALVQALGRQRNGGECHVIMFPSTNHIEGTVLKSEDGKDIRWEKSGEEYQRQNEAYTVLVKDYDDRFDMLRSGIAFLQDGQTHGVVSNYPSLQDHLLTEGAKLTLIRKLSGGRGLVPYLLWAACNNQFNKVKLERVTYYSKPTITIKLSSDDFRSNMEQILFIFPELEDQISGATVHEAFEMVHGKLFGTHPLSLFFKLNNDKESYTVQKAKKNQQVLRFLFSSVLFDRSGERLPVKRGKTLNYEQNYFRTMLSKNGDEADSRLRELFIELRNWRNIYQDFIEAQTVKAFANARTNVLHPHAAVRWEQAESDRFVSMMDKLRKVDPVFLLKAFNSDRFQFDATADREKIFDLARTLFTKLNYKERIRTDVTGKKDNAYKIKTGWKVV